MDEDGDDAYHYDEGDGGAHDTRPCEACGGTNFFADANGDVVCLQCGTQSQDVRVLTQEEFGGAAGSGQPGEARLVRRRRKLVRDTFVAAHHTFNTTDFAMALQSVLLLQAGQVCALTGAPAPLFHEAVSGVWRRYTAKWSHAQSPLVHVLNGRVVGNGEPAYYARIAADGQQPPPIPAASLLLLTGMTLTACRLLHLPVHSGHMSRWCAGGQVTWLNAYGALQDSLQITLKLAAPFFMPAGPPAPSALDRALSLLNLSLGLQAKPLNVHLCAHNMVREGRLPDSLLPGLMELIALDEHDRAHAPAYARLITRDRGPAGMRKVFAHADELARLRASTSRDSGAYVAAVVAVAMTLHAGWEAWVDAHLHPSVVGTVSGNLCTNLCPAQQECGTGGRTGRQALAPVQATVLTQAEASHLTSHILQGGDVGVGRGGSDYRAGAFTGIATVTLTDPVLTRVLQAAGQGKSAAGDDAVAALDRNSRAAIASTARAEARAGRSTTTHSMLALLMGSQASASALPVTASQRSSGAFASQGGRAPQGGYPGASQAGNDDMEDSAYGDGDADDEDVVPLQLTVNVGSRAMQPGHDTARGHTWPPRLLQDVAAHARAIEAAGALLRHGGGGAVRGKASAQNDESESDSDGDEDDDDDASGASAGAGAKGSPAHSDAVHVRTGLDALPSNGMAELQARGWQGSHLLPGRWGAFPRHAHRPPPASVRWQSLLEHLSSFSGAHWEEAAVHADGLSLLLQLYTPMPDKPVRALARMHKGKRKMTQGAGAAIADLLALGGGAGGAGADATN